MVTVKALFSLIGKGLGRGLSMRLFEKTRIRLFVCPADKMVDRARQKSSPTQAGIKSLWKSDVRLIELKGEHIVDQPIQIPSSAKIPTAINLRKGDRIEELEFMPSFKSRLKSEDRPEAFRNAMTKEEAIAYDKAHRQLSDRGLVWLDNKYDNFAFEPHPSPSFPGELRMVILDRGGIVPVKNKDPKIANHIQSFVNGGGDAALRHELTSVVGPTSPWFVGAKREFVRDNYGEFFDVKALGFKSNDIKQVPFNPISVENFPTAMTVTKLPTEEARKFHEQFRRYKLQAGKSGSSKQ
jgi:hypothetical protein